MVGTAAPATAPATKAAQLSRADQEFMRRVATRRRFHLSKTVLELIVFGLASLALYAFFFIFIDDLQSQLTSGSIGGAVLVIGLALTFSLVHGSFAHALLEAVGIRELKKE